MYRPRAQFVGPARTARPTIGLFAAEPLQQGSARHCGKQTTVSEQNEASDDFDAAVRAHDRALARRGFEIWVGAEPTFTDRRSENAEWVSAALGEDKLARAERLLLRLAGESPGAALMRAVGRRYPGEDRPRWSLGLLAARDGSPVWNGPADPLLATGDLPRSDARRFATAMLTRGATPRILRRRRPFRARWRASTAVV